MKIAHYFDFVINSYDAGIEKPNPEIFKKAMKESEIEGLQPKECLHIGHSIQPDYFGAQKAGMYLLINHHHQTFLTVFFTYLLQACMLLLSTKKAQIRYGPNMDPTLKITTYLIVSLTYTKSWQMVTLNGIVHLK